MARFAVVGVVVAALAACGGGGGGAPACPSGQDRCGDACVDLATDAAHCGACTTSCSATQVCSGGACGCPAALSPCGTTCVDLTSSAEHCGTCGTACPAGAACVGGLCLAVCAPPEVACGLACADLASDATSCGRCGRACAPGATCAAGACAAAACAGPTGLPGPPALPLEAEVLAAGDLDEDGRPDLVGATNATVAVALGIGGGRFAPGAPVALPAGAWAAAVVLRDLDGDGHLDLAVPDRSGAIHLLPGLGDGTFGARTSLGADAGADGLAVVDLDGDGHLDLAVSAQGAFAQGSLAVWWGDGAAFGSYGGAVGLAVTGRPSDVAAADLDGDGRPDLAVTGYAAGTVGVFLARATPSRTDPFRPEQLVTVGGGTQTVALADLDLDGHLDLVTSSATPGAATSVALGRGDGTFQAATMYPGGGDGVAVADLDGDGHLDVATAPGLVFLGGGDGSLTAAPLPIAPGGASGVAAADLDGDGRIDLAFGRGLVAERLADGWLLPSFSPDAVAQALVDLDGDLEPDLVSSEFQPAARGLAVRRGLGDGRLGPAQLLGPEAWPGAVAAGDLDGDGHLDLVAGDAAAVRAFTGDGLGGFALTATVPVSQPVADLRLSDLDGDGRADLVTMETDGALRVWPGTPGGLAAPATVADDATALLVADLDGDGTPDLAAGRAGGALVSIWFDVHTLAFPLAAPLGLQVQRQVSGLAAGDLDGDAVTDLLVTAGDGPSWTQYFAAVAAGLGGGAFALPVRALEGWAPRLPLLADLDGDGLLDLVALSEAYNHLVVARGAGGGAFAAPERYGANARPLAAADLDRDGRPDLVCNDGAGGFQLRPARCGP